MFTGIIEGIGTIGAIRQAGRGRRLVIDSDFPLGDTKPGDSISVSGACLTAVGLSGKRFEADVSPETLSLTTLGRARVGERVNLERALRFSDRLGGHLVSGHIDGIGTLTEKGLADNALVIAVEAGESISRYLIQKGSVAVDGVSLTVNACWEKGFRVSVIPHTAKMTTLGSKKTGDPVNIETDLIGKYVERFFRSGLRPAAPPSHAIDKEFLAKTGFLG